jgi:hypothetical protein
MQEIFSEAKNPKVEGGKKSEPREKNKKKKKEKIVEKTKF